MPKILHGKKIKEELWDEAKKSAEKQGRGNDYAYIMGILKNMAGIEKGYNLYDPQRHKEDLYRSLATNEDFCVFTPATIYLSDDIQKSVPQGTDVIQVIQRGELDPEINRDRMIGGYASTETLDRQDEQIIAKGLDFSECVNFGWYNDNHIQDTSAIIGVPTQMELHRHEEHGFRWFSKGFILNGYPRADRIWELAKSLQPVKRHLGFSVEGKVVERAGARITKALIRNIAITANPVNTECTWDILVRAMSGSEEFYKALSAGATTAPLAGGSVLIPESLEGKMKVQVFECAEDGKKFLDKSEYEAHLKTHKKEGVLKSSAGTLLTQEEAVKWILNKKPSYGETLAEAVVLHVFKNGKGE
jgi:hypothetical protein